MEKFYDNSFHNTQCDEAAFLDKEVHMLISEYSENNLLQLVNDSLSSLMEQFIFKSRRVVIQNDGDVLTEYHKQMLKCLMNKDADGGIEAINKHYDAMDKYIDDFFWYINGLYWQKNNIVL